MVLTRTTVQPPDWAPELHSSTPPFTDRASFSKASLASLTCKEHGSRQAVLPTGKKLNKLKSTHLLRDIRERRSQGKPSPLQLESQMGRYRESQPTKAETRTQKTQQQPVPVTWCLPFNKITRHTKRQTHFEETEQTSEPDTEMSDWESKIW